MYSKDYEELCNRVEKIDKDAADYMRGDARNIDCFAESDDISACFEWERTAQGWQYWKNIEDLLDDLKPDDEIIAELSQRLADAQDQCIALRAETSRLYAVLSDSNREIKEAAEELDRTKSIMSFYFLAAVFIGVFIGVFWG